MMANLFPSDNYMLQRVESPGLALPCPLQPHYLLTHRKQGEHGQGPPASRALGAAHVVSSSEVIKPDDEQ